MMPKEDFENRLGKGLKRWAEAGEPTLDLEALVRARAEEPAAEVAAPRRGWVRWLGVAAAAAALVIAAGTTFPSWAGAAAEWPLVGPMVKEIIMEDAGLKWAYDMGFIQQPMAEVTQDGITVRILGVVADRARTTVIYQVVGWSDPKPEPVDAKPIQGGKWLSMSRPVHTPPDVFISHDDGLASWGGRVVETPVGLLGTASTWPLTSDEAQVKVIIGIGEKRLTLPLTVKRTAEASREVRVDQSQEIGGITIHVDSVVYTPAETMLRYRVEKESLAGAVNLQQVGGISYLEVGDRRVTADSSVGASGQHIIVFPEPVEGEVRFVIPGEYQATPVTAVFPLEVGATQSILGAQVELTDLNRMGSMLGLEFKWPWASELVGLAGYELIDASGQTVGFETDGEGIWHDAEREVQGRRVDGTIPEGFEPVAVRITRAGVAVPGPWIFNLPQ